MEEKTQMDEISFLTCVTFLSPKEILENLCLVCKDWQETLMESTWLWRQICVQQFKCPEEMPFTMLGIKESSNQWLTLCKILHIKAALTFHGHSFVSLTDILFVFFNQQPIIEHIFKELSDYELPNLNRDLSDQERKLVLKNLFSFMNVENSETLPIFSWIRPTHKHYVMNTLLKNDYFLIKRNNSKKVIFKLSQAQKEPEEKKKKVSDGTLQFLEYKFLSFDN